MILFSEMEITLYGISALGFWLSQEGRHRCDFGSAQGALASLAKPLHVSMRKGSRSGRSSHVEHAVMPVGAGATIRVAEGLCVPTPELCFVQISASMPFHQAVKAGCALCSTFRLDPRCPFGVREREPLTSVSDLEAFIEANSGMRGAGRARVALRYVKERTASPAEVYLTMLLTLPPHRGGFGLDALQPNRPVCLSKRATEIAQRSYLIPDLYDAEHHIAIEYDADATHTTGQQLSRDSTKRLALESMGIKVITVTTRQLSSIERMGDVAGETARAMGKRMRLRSAQHESARSLLAATRRTFDGLYDREWLMQQRASCSGATGFDRVA